MVSVIIMCKLLMKYCTVMCVASISYLFNLLNPNGYVIHQQV